VIPLLPLDAWAGITQSEPWFNATTGTVFVSFTTPGEPGPDVEVNALFWDPHTSIGPGQADTYNPAPLPQ
jgi:hypothetical protein